MSGCKRTAAEEDALAEARRRDAINGEKFAIRRQLRAMTAHEHELEEEMAAMLEREERTKAEIERIWRAQHWGNGPERAWAWRDASRNTEAHGPGNAEQTAPRDRGSTARREQTGPPATARTEHRVSWRASTAGPNDRRRWLRRPRRAASAGG